MSSKIGFSFIAGAIALALAGTAAASTSLDAANHGDLFINVVDTTNGSSFLYDTGESQSQFLANPTGTLNYNFSTDPNYQAFVAAQGGSDVIDYSILSATKPDSSNATILFTGSSQPAAQTGNNISNAQTSIGGFFFQANQVTESSYPDTNVSAYITATNGNTWGQTAYETTVDGKLGLPYTQAGTGDAALPGTALNFYETTSTNLSSARNTNTTVEALAGTWNFSAGDATYSAVPLPTPVLLLLSGLGLMGVVARRKKSLVAV